MEKHRYKRTNTLSNVIIQMFLEKQELCVLPKMLYYSLY